MHYPNRRVHLPLDTCLRLSRIHRGSGIPLCKLINGILIDYVDEDDAAPRRGIHAVNTRSWRRR